MKRLICFVLLACILLSGCAGQSRPEATKYTATFLTLFDTVTTIVSYSYEEEQFRAAAQSVHDELLQYHQLFDIYNDYEGVTNLKTVNASAGTAPVTVDRRIIDLLLECKAYYDLTGGKVNVAMGSVLQLWHEARNDGINDPANASLPEEAKLQEASLHTDFDAVVIDEEASTVFITDPMVQLDVGAVAKGWSVQRAAENAAPGLLISVGGNVCATGLKGEAQENWVVGVQDPDQGDSYLHTLYIGKESLVTSGDYQRAYAVDGKRYHHIIDPETLYPSTLWRSVTILCDDSGLADALSTALFLLPREEGQRLLDACGAMAMWVDADRTVFYSTGFEQRIRN